MLEVDTVPAVPMFKTYKKNGWDSFLICLEKNNACFPAFSSQLIYFFLSLQNF